MDKIGTDARGSWRSALLVMAALLIAAVACWAAQHAAKLIVNGRTASTDVRIINGKAYAPLADVAKALNMVIAKRGGNYEMVAPGGANQVEGARQGKIGDVLFTGKWRFSVLGIERVDRYQEQFYQGKKTLTPQGAGENLLIVRCRIANGMKEAKSPILSERMSGKTALAGDQGQSFGPLDYDARQASDKWQDYAAAALLPGAGMEFTLVFSVPTATDPKSLVFTMLTYPDDVGGKGTDVRIELRQ